MLVKMISSSIAELPSYSSETNIDELLEEFLDQHIVDKQTGKTLHGEVQMFMRICQDCHKSDLPWYCVHSRYSESLSADRSEHQRKEIDFILLCPKGLVVVEVKGGIVQIEDGHYVNIKGNDRRSIEPFVQADQAMFYLKSNVVPSYTKYMTFATCCAFPHASIEHTSNNSTEDLYWKLWSKPKMDSDDSFADFCLDVLEKEHRTNQRELSLDEMKDVFNRLVPPSVSTPSLDVSSEYWRGILERLRIQSVETVRSLVRNDRIIIEGGPGTGKTTIAKEFVLLNREKRGLYLCWNKLLKGRIEGLLASADLRNCRVEKYTSFLHSIDNSFVDDGQSYEKMCCVVANAMAKERKNASCAMYDYVIIDEAQDVFSRGVIELIKGLTSVESSLETSKFLVLYDADQGYLNHKKPLDEYAGCIAKNAAFFQLLENRRASSTKEIVKLAEDIYKCDGDISLNQLLDSVKNEYVNIQHFDTYRSLIAAIRTLNTSRVQHGLIQDLVMLVDSRSQYVEVNNADSLYDYITELEEVKLLDENNIASMDMILNIPVATILSYKGLENKSVVLVVSENNYATKYQELYVGLTRAIHDVKIWLYKEK